MRADIRQLKFVHPALRLILPWLEDKTGLEYTITSLYRMDEPTSVHGTLPVRGCDLRMRNRDIAQKVEDFVNAHWQYDPSREEMRCAKAHGYGMEFHLHLQVHDNTVMIVR